MSESILRTDLIPQELLVDPNKITVVAETLFNNIVNSSEKAPADNSTRTRTPGNSKDIVEVAELIEQAIRNYEKRERVIEEKKLNVVYERPERPFDKETVAISFMSRTPGMFGQGRPGENKTKNLRPILREVVEDPDNPGYKRAVLGYYYDNVIRLTAWARTNKEANDRAVWLENIMEEYTWWFSYSGVNRLIYEGWRSPVMLDISNTVYYGRPIDFYVRTEKLSSLSQKSLEEILIYVGISST